MNSRNTRPAAAVAMVAAAFVALGLSFAALAQEPDPTVPSDASASPSILASPAPTAIAEDAGSEAGDGGAGETGAVVVEAGDLWFAPTEITLSSAQPTQLVLDGVGVVAHNLIVDDLGLQLHVGPGGSSEVTVSDLPPGTYTFYCSIYGHRRAGMSGTLTIE